MHKSQKYSPTRPRCQKKNEINKRLEEFRIQPAHNLLSARPLSPRSHSPKRDSLAGQQQLLLVSLSLSVNAWRSPALPHGPSTHGLLIDVGPCWWPLQSHFPQIWSDDQPSALPLNPRKTLIQTQSKSAQQESNPSLCWE